MATYVMSDLHGAYDAFCNMLRQIDFSKDDELYILGDVVDRGEDGVSILRHTMAEKNIHLLLGNHEYMFMQFFEDNPSQTVVRRWNRNGNFYTLTGFDKLTESEKEETLAYIRQLPSEQHITVYGKKYYLVHGFIGVDTHERVWNRPKYEDIPEIDKDTTVIVGHTPVCEYVCPGSDEQMYVYSHELTLRGEHFQILHAPHFIDVDCCVGYGFSAARLACLRLEDGAEFYEKVGK
ncbi:MAG: metallophosphoesterase family protein [Clostridia bacterium]|nr:metallophosphoesterase family protein [Clostridia bacterium]